MAQFVGDRQLTVASAHKRTMTATYYRQTGPTPPETMEVRVGGKFMDADSSTATAWARCG